MACDIKCRPCEKHVFEIFLLWSSVTWKSSDSQQRDPNVQLRFISEVNEHQDMKTAKITLLLVLGL
jgi:hypothetical protein